LQGETGGETAVE